jgi:AraC-like DNA-binding protein
MNNDHQFSRSVLVAVAKVKGAIDHTFNLVTGTAQRPDNPGNPTSPEWKNAETFARELKVNRKELQSAFKHCNSKGINEYQVERKIEAACILLANDEMTIKEIATKLDFDQEYFSSVFKKKKGRTPTEWKGMYAAGNPS